MYINYDKISDKDEVNESKCYFLNNKNDHKKDIFNILIIYETLNRKNFFKLENNKKDKNCNNKKNLQEISYIILGNIYPHL